MLRNLDLNQSKHYYAMNLKTVETIFSLIWHCSCTVLGSQKVTKHVPKASVLLSDYNKIWGYAVGCSIRWNLLRLFWTDYFDPAARLSGQTEKLTPIVWQSQTRQTTAYHFQLLFSPYTHSPTGPIYPTFWSSDPTGNGTLAKCFKKCHLLNHQKVSCEDANINRSTTILRFGTIRWMQSHSRVFFSTY